MKTILNSTVLLILLLVHPAIAGHYSTSKVNYAPAVSPQNGSCVAGNASREISAAHLTADPVPTYSYEALNNGTVKFTLLNNVSSGLSGDLIREGLTYPQNGEIITTFSLPQTGDRFTYIDDHVLPGKSYVYIFEYITESSGGYIINFDTVAVVSTIPALSDFYLIAPSYDDEYEVLHDGYEIVIEGTNIRAEANTDLTGSVVFYLNGKESRDNTAPFALFPEVKGDYKKGHLKNGTYTLTAVAFPEKNGKGIPGDTLTVAFTVNNIYKGATVNVYPNPLGPNSTVYVHGNAGDPVWLELSDGSGNGKTVHKGILDDQGQFQYSLSSTALGKGVYFLSVHIDGNVIQKRLIAE